MVHIRHKSTNNSCEGNVYLMYFLACEILAGLFMLFFLLISKCLRPANQVQMFQYLERVSNLKEYIWNSLSRLVLIVRYGGGKGGKEGGKRRGEEKTPDWLMRGRSSKSIGQRSRDVHKRSYWSISPSKVFYIIKRTIH